MNKLLKLTIFLMTIAVEDLKGQNIHNDYWLPFKRIDHIARIKEDKCDSSFEYPIKKIKFIGKNKVSIFGFETSDPTVCTLITTGNASWMVENCILYSVNHCMKPPKILFNRSKDAFIVKVICGNDTTIQRFINKYGDVVFTDYMENEIGNFLISGKFKGDNKISDVTFSENGRLEFSGTRKGLYEKFNRYKFIRYAQQSCQGELPLRIIEMSASNGKTATFLVQITNDKVEFYTIEKWQNEWSVEKKKLEFSLKRLQ